MKQMGRRLLALLLGAAMLLSLTGMTPDDSGEAAANSSRTEKAASEPVIDPANAETAAGGETAPAEKKSGAALEEKSEEEPEEELEEEIEEEPEEEPTDDPVSPVLVEGQEFDGEPDADMADGSDMGFAPSAEEGARVEDSPAPAANTLTLWDWDDTAKEIKERSVSVADNELPTARARDGWEFQGWYTKKVTYNFWGDDKVEYDTSSDALYAEHGEDPKWQYFYNTFSGKTLSGNKEQDAYDFYEFVYFNWVTLSEGEKAEVVLDGTTTYYALYRPNTLTITWDYNDMRAGIGQMVTDGVMTSQAYYDGYFTKPVPVELPATRVFDGWYDESGNQWVSMDNLPEVSRDPITQNMRYIARWHSEPAVEGIKIVRTTGTSDALDAGRQVKLKASFTPPASTMPGKFDWSCETQGVDIRPVNPTSNLSEVTVTMPTEPTAGAMDGPKDVVIKVTFKPSAGVQGAESLSADYTLTLRHEWLSEMVHAPNCFDKGQVVYHCARCSAEKRVYIDKLEHQIVTLREPASCTEAGYTDEYCTRCGRVITHTPAAALGHQWSTTVTEGCGGTVTTDTCTVCGLVQTTGSFNSADHDWESTPTVDKAPTCAAEGSQSIHCRNCSAAKNSTTLPADPALHVWGEWLVKRVAKANMEGEETRKCTVCGATQTRSTLTLNQQKALDEVKSSGFGSVEVTLNAAVQDAGATTSTLRSTLDALARSDDIEDQRLAAAAAAKLLDANSTLIAELSVTSTTPGNTAGFTNYFASGVKPNYLDASVVLRAVSSGADTFIGLISETAQPIAIGTELPTGGGPIYQVVREHDGVYETLPTWVENGVLYFSSDKFSTFAVGSSNDITYAAISPIPDQGYTGAAVTPGIQLTINGSTVLTEGRDYTVSYRSNTDIGTATVVITGIGDFTGTREITFRIVVPTGDDQVDGTNVNAAPKEDPPAAGEDEYIVCEACGYHFWEPYLEGWRCTTCGHLRGTTGVPGAAAAAKRSYRGTIPQTADEFPLGGVAAVFVLSLAGLGTVLVLRRKRR